MVLIVVMLHSLSCEPPHKIQAPHNQPSGGIQTITSPIIEKPFIKKNGVSTDQMEYYIRRSMQDYFIKFCESPINRAELDTYLESVNDPIKTATMDIEIRQGEWDNCGQPIGPQSRVGTYIVILKIY